MELLALKVFYSSKQGKADLTGNSEIASLVLKREVTDSLSAGQMTFAQCHGFLPLHSRGAESGPQLQWVCKPNIKPQRIIFQA